MSSSSACASVSSTRCAIRLRSDVPVGRAVVGRRRFVVLSPQCSSSIVGHDAAPRLLSAVSNDARLDESRHIETMERHLGQQAQKITLSMAPERLDGRALRRELVQRRAGRGALVRVRI